MFTTAQKAIFHIVASSLVGVGLGVYSAVAQYAASGNFNLGQALSFFGLTFVSGLASAGVSIWHSVQASPALPQAENDTVNQVLDFLSKDFGDFLNQHFGHVGDRLKALEDAIANHSHTPLPTPLDPSRVSVNVPQMPSNVVQLPFPPQGTASVPMSSLVVTPSAPQPQAPILTTLPTLQAMPK